MSRKHTLSELLNELTYRNNYYRLKNLALNMFTWEGLPPGMRPEYIEEILYNNGRALFINDKNLGFLCLRALPSGGVNVYGVNTQYYASGFNYNVLYDLDEAVLIKNNPLQVPTHDYMMMYAERISEIERTLDVNVKAQKTPYIIACDDKDKLTWKNIYSQVDGNTPAIYADKNLNLGSLEVLQTNAPFICDKLADYKHDVWNDAMTFLGINNANTDKRERLVADEVNANNEAVELNAYFMLDTRQRAVDEINEMFGLNISVKQREVVTDGTVHTDPTGDN